MAAYTAKSCLVEDVGKLIASSKKKATWIVGIMDTNHQVELFHTLHNHKVKVLLDGEEVYKDESSTKSLPIIIGFVVITGGAAIPCSIKVTGYTGILGTVRRTSMSGYSYDLSVDGISYSKMRRGSVFEVGSPAPKPSLQELNRIMSSNEILDKQEKEVKPPKEESAEELNASIKALEASIEEKNRIIEAKKKFIEEQKNELVDLAIAQTPGEREKMERLKSRSSSNASIAEDKFKQLNMGAMDSSNSFSQVTILSPSRREERRKKSDAALVDIDAVADAYVKTPKAGTKKSPKKSTKKERTESDSSFADSVTESSIPPPLSTIVSGKEDDPFAIFLPTTTKR